MNAATTERSEAIDEVARTLLPRASLLTRLLLRRAGLDLSRSESGLLSALSAGPQRITELAEREELAQPTVTLLVKRLEARGWARRERDAADGRAVLVSLTAAGRAKLEEVRASYRGHLRERLVAMTDEQVADLTAATAALETLIQALQRERAA